MYCIPVPSASSRPPRARPRPAPRCAPPRRWGREAGPLTTRRRAAAERSRSRRSLERTGRKGTIAPCALSRAIREHEPPQAPNRVQGWDRTGNERTICFNERRGRTTSGGNWKELEPDLLERLRSSGFDPAWLVQLAKSIAQGTDEERAALRDARNRVGQGVTPPRPDEIFAAPTWGDAGVRAAAGGAGRRGDRPRRASRSASWPEGWPPGWGGG